MIIPYRVDVPYDRRPFVNWLIIVGLITVFSMQVAVVVQAMSESQTPAEEAGEENEPLQPIRQYVLDGWRAKGLFGHMWLHGGLLHLAGNLIFLWVFGNAVCAKIGNIVYLPAYLVFGLAAAASHLTFVGGSVIGASGAINGVVGMYVVFFPENEVNCLWILFFPYVKKFSVSSIWIILLFFVFDVLGAMFLSAGAGGVAYFAHLGGFICGAALAVVMLKTKWVRMERYEKSLLEWLGLQKSETEESMRKDLLPWHPQYATPEPTEVAATTAAPEKPAPKIETIPLEGEGPSEEFIRFACACGKRFKLPAAFAGKTGRCPQCKTPLKIPGQSKPQAGTAGREAEKAKEGVLRLTCSCGKRFRVPLELAGRVGRCPRCNSRFKIPEKPLA
ncbi:MAG TPA: rhomboid family intramembrane serine protease [Sedimentisphaerales bacterium]|nr:rhomboid family intramembrane serine protease [Sedimentisphaerales bacterium]